MLAPQEVLPSYRPRLGMTQECARLTLSSLTGRIFPTRVPTSIHGSTTLELHGGGERSINQRASQASVFPCSTALLPSYCAENPKILAALQCSFSYVFLDEFQDTTEPQYDLISTSFLGTDTVVTAVGDSKQRIVLWAGAMSSAFECFIGDYGATRRELIMNHRSSPALVSVLGAIADAVEQGTPASQPTQSTGWRGLRSARIYGPQARGCRPREDDFE